MQAESDKLKNFRREFLWRFSKYRLHPQDLTWAQCHDSTLRRLSIEPMINQFGYVWDTLMPNSQTLARHIPELLPLAEAIAHYCAFHQRINQNTLESQDEMLAALSTAGIHPLLIKGGAMRANTDVLQAMNDLDMIALNLDEAWTIVEIVEKLGYFLDRFKLQSLGKHVKGEPRYYGYAPYVCRREGGGQYIQGDWDLGRVRTLDLHIARFHSVGDGVLLTDLRQKASFKSVNNTKVFVPCTEDMVLIELAHLLRHGTITMRGLNRIFILLYELGDIDQDYLLHQIKENQLSLMAQAIFLTLGQTFPETQAITHRLRLPLESTTLGSKWAITGLATRRRVEKFGAGSLVSTWLQARYLYGVYRQQLGSFWSLLHIAIAFLRLFTSRKIYPRSYKRWRKRQRGWLSEKNPSIMFTRLDREPWDIEKVWNTFKQERLNTTSKCLRIHQHSLMLDIGQISELLLTPVGSFTTANYAGQLPEEELKLCLEKIKTFRHLCQ